MAVTTEPAGGAGVAAPPPLRSPASPASQALVVGVLAVTFAALATRMGSSLWFAAPTAALLAGVVIGLQLDLRRFFVVVPGLVAGLATLVLLTFLWAVALSWLAVELPYALVPLAALVAFGADWWWVERLRPVTVASGAVLVLLVANDVSGSLPLALVWFATAIAALWSLRRDAGRVVPAPVPLDGTAVPIREPGAGRAAAAVAASWLVAALLVGLLSLVPTWLDSPATPGRLAGDGGVGGDGSGSSGQTGGGPDAGLGPSGVVDGDLDGDGFRDDPEDRDVDGDGIPDRDVDGDGIPDVDIDGDGIPDVDRDGDGIPDAAGGREVVTDPGGAAGGSGAGGTVDDGTSGGEDLGGRGVARVLGIAVVALLVVALVALAVGAVARERARRRALAARPWAIRLAERLEHEGARRGRARHRDEPVTRYADALATDVLAHDRLADVGAALSSALFGAAAPSEATGTWAAGVVDEAVEANPPPSRLDPIRDRLRRRPR